MHLSLELERDDHRASSQLTFYNTGPMRIKLFNVWLSSNNSDILSYPCRAVRKVLREKQWSCFGLSVRHEVRRNHPAKTTEICLQLHTDRKTDRGQLEVSRCHKHKDKAFVPKKAGLPPLQQSRHTTPPWGQTHGDMAGTHSFGFGLVGSGGASFPGDGDSFGVGVESGTV